MSLVAVFTHLPLLGVPHDNFATLCIIFGNPHCRYILRSLGGGEGRRGEERGEVRQDCNKRQVVNGTHTHITKYSPTQHEKCRHEKCRTDRDQKEWAL